MEFLGIGPLELIFIILIALVLLGPNDMLKATRGIGKFLRTLFTSQAWADFQRSFSALRNLPYTMAREAGLDDEVRTFKENIRMDVPAAVLPTPEEMERVKTIEEVSAQGDDVIVDTPFDTLEAAQEEVSILPPAQESTATDGTHKDAAV